MRYHQITPAERYTLATLRTQVPRPSNAHIAHIMGAATAARSVVSWRATVPDLTARTAAAKRRNGPMGGAHVPDATASSPRRTGA